MGFRQIGRATFGAVLRRAGLLLALAAVNVVAHADPSWIVDDKGCKHLNPYARPGATETVHWTGSCADGFADGRGIQQWFVNGEPTGRFTGTMKRGRYTGNGELVGANGSTYQGGFVEGKRSGHGVWLIANGDRLEGEFVDDVPVDPSVVQQVDGTRYEAHFDPAIKDAPVELRCPQRAKPVLPPVNWQGTAKFWATATFHDGRAISVKVSALTPLGNDAVEKALGNAVETTIRQQYQCTGDQVIAQEFVFKVDSADPVWITDNKGCKHSTRGGPLRSNDVLTWTGNCTGGLADGDGVEEWLRDGKPVIRFTGAMRQGLYATEHGSLWAGDGSTYEGSFSDGDPNGHGIFHWANGNSYEGEVLSGKPYGQGHLSLSNGATYQGGVANNHFSGAGVFVYPNGTRLEGVFVDDRVSGHGVLLLPDGSRYEGDFVSGLQTGYGTQQWADGTIYKGDFVNGKGNGHGVRYEANGDQLEGEFFDGHLRGPVTVTQADGTRYQAHYDETAGASPDEDADSLCTHMGKLELPAVDWTGEASFWATATFHDGQVTVVKAVAKRHLGDPVTQAALAHAIESTIRKTYQCPGDHVISQDFDFKIEQ